MIKWHKPPLFEVCYFAFCPDVTVWEKERASVKKQCVLDIGEYPTNPGMLVCWHDKFNNPRGLVVLDHSYDTNPVGIIGLLVHESVHVVEMILDAAQETEPGEETRARI